MSYGYLDGLSHSDRVCYMSKLRAVSGNLTVQDPCMFVCRRSSQNGRGSNGLMWHTTWSRHRVCLQEKVWEIDRVSRHTTSSSLVGSKQCVTSSLLTALTAFWRLMSLHPSRSMTTPRLGCTKITGLWQQHTVIALWVSTHTNSLKNYADNEIC